MAKKTLPKGWKLSGNANDPKKMRLIAPDGCKLRYPSEVWRYIKRKNLKLKHSDFTYYQQMTGRQMISVDTVNDSDNHQLANLTDSDNKVNASSSTNKRKRKLDKAIEATTNSKRIKHKTPVLHTVSNVVETRKTSARLQQKQGQKAVVVSAVNQDTTQQIAIISRSRRSIRNEKINNYKTTAEQKNNVQKQHTSRSICKTVTQKSVISESPTGQLFPVITRSKSKTPPTNINYKEIEKRHRKQPSNVNTVNNDFGLMHSTKVENHQINSISNNIDNTDKTSNVEGLKEPQGLGLRDRLKLIKTFKAKILQEEHTQKFMKPSKLDIKTPLKINPKRLNTATRLRSYINANVDKDKSKINSSCKQLGRVKHLNQLQLSTGRSRILSNRQKRTLKTDDNIKTNMADDSKRILNIQNQKSSNNKASISRSGSANGIRSRKKINITDGKSRNTATNTTMGQKIKRNKNDKSAKFVTKNRIQVTKVNGKIKTSTKSFSHAQERSNDKKLIRKLQKKGNNEEEVKSVVVKSKSRNPYEITSGKRIPRHIKGPKWTPPKSPYNLIQEQLFDDPWKLLVATLFLHNVTDRKGAQMLSRFFSKYPTPQIASVANCKEMIESFSSIDMQENRAKIIIKFSEEYNKGDWCYPCELFGIGKYGNDSYRIFCVNEWKKVIPRDYNLVLYHKWLCQEYKYVPRKQPDVLFDYTIGRHETNLSKYKEMYKLNMSEKSVTNPINC